MASDDIAVRNRFESFKLGKGLPPAVATKHAHARSHSRNTSSLSLSPNDFSFLPSSPSPTATTHPVPPQPPSKRNSHHRRRSSVSTRHESAEMMGVALPDLPPSTSDDNINLGEKDSIRRRALWALEGKPDVSFSKVEIPDISTPDIEKMLFDFATKPSAYGNSLTASGKRDSFKLLASSSSSKDQLGTLLEEEEEEDEPLPSPAASIKENLPPPPNTPISPNTPMTPALSITKPTPSKSRPSNLNLRPLSLTPDNLPGIIASLPSPSPTPSPRQGLRSLSLTPNNSGSGDDHPSSLKQSRRSSLVISPTPNSRRPILNLALDQLDHTSSVVLDDDQKLARRSSISYKRSHTSVNSAGLPTPEMTPTFSRRTSSSLSSNASNDVDDEVFANPPTPQTRPLSASEQHFLFKSHNALLARITDLERALSMRRRESGGYSNGASSRPTSVASNFSSSSSGLAGNSSEPSDEMLNLIADLKSERDELKRDVDGWRTRVGDMESQMTVLSKRVENERREAWVARSRVGLLEVEKEVLTKKMAALDEMFAAHEKERCGWVSEMDVLRKENEDSKKRVRELEEELSLVRQELADERMRKDPMSTPTPRSFDSFTKGLTLTKKHGLGFASVDSESSSTDVEHDSSDDNHRAFGFSLKSVQEESDEADYSEEDTGLAVYEDEDDNGLVGYEDEEDTDMSLQSSSSYGSEENISPRSLSHLQNVPVSPTTPKPNQVFTPPRSNHARRATLSKTWTFPFGGQPPQTPLKEEEEDTVDRFFGCLEDGENDMSGSVPSSPSAYSYEKSKGLFSSGFKFAAEDDNASFFLPDGVGILADEEDKDEKRLSVVTEEEEEESEQEMEDDDDDDMFGEIGGIRITFTPPQEETEVAEERRQIQVSPIKRASPPPVLPVLNFGGDEEDGEEEEEEDVMHSGIPFNFGRPLMDERKPSPPPVTVVVTPISVHSRPSSPSMIPRPASPSPVVAASVVVCPPPVRTVPVPTSSTPSPSSNSFTTPPNKRGGALPSFIPQPVSSPSPMRSIPASTKPRVIPTSTFIRQPSRKPLLPPSTAGPAKVHQGTGNPNVPSAMNTRSFRRSPDERNTPAVLPPAVFFDGRRNQHRTSAAQMKSIDFSHDSVFSAAPFSPPPPPPLVSSRYSRNAKSSVSSNASSSISSMVSSPLSARLSFQTITNFMPLSWAPRQAATDVPSVSLSQHTPADSLDDDPTIVAPVSPRQNKGGYISRERQLRKLRNRMEVEGVLAMKMQVQVECKKCDGDMVYI